MKKLSLILLPLMLMLGFTACDDDVDQIVRVCNESYSTVYAVVAPVEYADDLVMVEIRPGDFVDFRVSEVLVDGHGHFTYVHIQKKYGRSDIETYPVDLDVSWRPEVVIGDYDIVLPR